MDDFIPTYRRLLFLVRCMCWSRSPSSFCVELGAAMIIAFIR